MSNFNKLMPAFVGGIGAGMLVGIGGTVLMSVEDRIVGAVMFTIALLAICYLGLYLFTGRIGFAAEQFDRFVALNLAAGLLGNFIGATLTGLIMRFARPSIIRRAVEACTARLENGILRAFLLGCFCGVLMYAAVKIYKLGSPLGIIFCIPVFILSGFEHSIADMFYFALAGMINLSYLGFIVAVIVGNSVGALALAMIWKVANNK